MGFLTPNEQLHTTDSYWLYTTRRANQIAVYMPIWSLPSALGTSAFFPLSVAKGSAASTTAKAIITRALCEYGSSRLAHSTFSRPETWLRDNRLKRPQSTRFELVSRAIGTCYDVRHGRDGRATKIKQIA